ncbi:MAG: aspartate--ammonia ligase [Firmicutes bacterium]|nr:aspartate--ammonia ligase [Bacillota bacterium]
MDLFETQKAIKKVKDFFQDELSKELNLQRVTAPLVVDPDTGLNDNLNGVERTVSFTVKDINECKAEVVQSLAKWKRMALGRYNVKPGKGIYTDMNALRRDEDLDNIHSIYVDQWDWEKTMTKEERTEEYLKETVNKIYGVMKRLGDYVAEQWPELKVDLPENIYFVTSQELEYRWPELTAKEREHAIAKEQKAVFIMKIGDVLASGQRHDGRAPDYDDWNLNGDILVWNSVLNQSLELSSMGVRVDETAMARQLKLAKAEERAELPFHKAILEKKLPYSIGGGIGQSRLCMFFLKRAHIGEIQVGMWPEEMIRRCEENNIFLL